MKYIIMCGGKYGGYPKQILKVMGESLLSRTIRLLRSYGAEDIAVSTNDSLIEVASQRCGVQVLHHNNNYEYGYEEKKAWL